LESAAVARVLLTAFEPYDHWQVNSSWLTLIEFTKEMPGDVAVTTRLYPVNYEAVSQRLEQDLQENHDVVLHLGQAPETSHIRLEAVGLNLAAERPGSGEVRPLCPDGPLGYRSELPLADYAATLRRAGIPAHVSDHAGVYLCNAALYLSHHLARRMNLSTKTAFVHLPLDPSQVTDHHAPPPSMPATTAARALRVLIQAAAASRVGPRDGLA
jgi:pyroglutamyl-peptidase